jgi:methanogenic corrinoid protein MtbC1
MDALIETPGAEAGRSEGREYLRYWTSLYRRDVGAAARVVERCLREWTPQRIYLRLFEPALNLSGAAWAEGRIHYQDEHFITWHTLRLMRRVRREFVLPDPTGPLALATGVGQESHAIGLRMACDFLQSVNWRVRFLPSNDRAIIRDAAAALKPDAFLFSIGLDRGLEPARRAIGELRRQRYAGLVVVGGGAINQDMSVVEKIGADLTALNGMHLIRRLKARMPQWARDNARRRRAPRSGPAAAEGV